MAFIKKYGLNWPDGTLPIQIELYMIRQTDEFLADKKTTRASHYKNACKILWPHIDWHRWSELCNDEIRRPGAKCTVLLGAGSTGKTATAGWQYLLEYYASPKDTLVLISSTDIRGLELRVWGSIKSLHEMAKEKYDWIPGNLIDSKHCIATDDLDDDDVIVRDLRKGVIGIPTVAGGRQIGLSKWIGIKQKHLRLVADECFPAGTLVDTPRGKIPIQDIATGDLVFNATGVGVVKNTMKKTCRSLIKLKTSDGREIICTPEHPVLTNKGWEKACNIIMGSYILSANEAMHIMSDNFQTSCPSNAMHCLPKSPKSLRVLQKGFLPAEAGCSNPFLYETVRAEMDYHNSEYQESLRGLQSGIYGIHAPDKLLRLQEKKSYTELQELRKGISERISEEEISFLQRVLFLEVVSETAGLPGQFLHTGTLSQNMGDKTKVFQRKSRGVRKDDQGSRGRIPEISELAFTETKTGMECGDFYAIERNGSQAAGEGWKRNWSYEGRENTAQSVSDCKIELSDKNKNEGWKWIPDLLQTGFGVSKSNAGNRSGRRESRSDFKKKTGCEKRPFPIGAWLVGCETIEQKDFHGNGVSDFGIEVYNLEVSGHPSYSVNGFLVHNCQSMSASFLSAFSNLNNNVDFQALALGNPNDVLDPLGIAAEPKDGWSGHLEPDKTSVWDTQFFNGRCVNLVGTDSPNFDYPDHLPPKYPYLVSHKKIQETLSAFKKDSFEYYSQCVGVMKISQLARRVITRDLCRQFHVVEKAVWIGEKNTKVAALDSAYGGDRCVGGDAEFGKCSDGKIRLQFNVPHIVPVTVQRDRPMAAEDSISEYEKEFCVSSGIPAANFFHDSTGRGSLGTSLSRVWSSDCNPVEFGGSPTKRPVTMDTFIIDKDTMVRRLKRCDEHYSKFVTELYWSFRLAVEADQIRGLPQEVIDELCMREWDRVKDDKIEVESKTEMKIRTRKSPDLADWAVIILEGARRLGFEIERLGKNINSEPESDYFDTESKAWHDAIKSGLLKR